MKTILEIINQSKDIRYSILFKGSTSENDIKRVSRVENIESRYISNIDNALSATGYERRNMSFKQLDSINNTPISRDVYMFNQNNKAL